MHQLVYSRLWNLLYIPGYSRGFYNTMKMTGSSAIFGVITGHLKYCLHNIVYIIKTLF